MIPSYSYPIKPIFPILDSFFPMGNCACHRSVFNTTFPMTFSYISNQFLFWSFIVLMIFSLSLLLTYIFHYFRNKKHGKKLVSPMFIWVLGAAINFLPVIASLIFDGKLKLLLLLTSVIGGIIMIIWGIKLKNYVGKKRLFWLLTSLYWAWILLAIINELFMNCMGASC